MRMTRKKVFVALGAAITVGAMATAGFAFWTATVRFRVGDWLNCHGYRRRAHVTTSWHPRRCSRATSPDIHRYGPNNDTSTDRDGH